MSEATVIKAESQFGTKNGMILSSGKFHILNSGEVVMFPEMIDRMIGNCVCMYENSLIDGYWLLGYDISPEDIADGLSKYGFVNADANILNFDNYRQGNEILNRAMGNNHRMPSIGPQNKPYQHIYGLDQYNFIAERSEEISRLNEKFSNNVHRLMNKLFNLKDINLYTTVDVSGEPYCVELSFDRYDHSDPSIMELTFKMISRNLDDSFMLTHTISVTNNGGVSFTPDTKSIFSDIRPFMINGSKKVVKTRFSNFMKYQIPLQSTIFQGQYYLMALANTMLAVVARKYALMNTDEYGFIDQPMKHIVYSKYAIEQLAERAKQTIEVLSESTGDYEKYKWIKSRKYLIMARLDKFAGGATDPIVQPTGLIDTIGNPAIPTIIFNKRENQFVEKFRDSYIEKHTTIDLHLLMSHMRYGSVFKVKNSELFGDKTITVSCRYDDQSSEIYMVDQLPGNMFLCLCIKMYNWKEFDFNNQIFMYYEMFSNKDSTYPTTVNELIDQSIIGEDYHRANMYLMYIIGLLIVLHERPHRSKMVRNVRYTREVIVKDDAKKEEIEKPYVISRVLRPAKEADEIIKNSSDAIGSEPHVRRESTYVVAEWERVGHWRTLKSGKVVWIPETICHRRKMNDEKAVYVKL